MKLYIEFKAEYTSKGKSTLYLNNANEPSILFVVIFSQVIPSRFHVRAMSTPVNYMGYKHSFLFGDSPANDRP